MKVSNKWINYEIIDAGNGEKLEKWDKIILRRPDPQAIWLKNINEVWDKADAVYVRSEKGGGHWEFKKQLPLFWTVAYKDLTFKVSPTNFKHTGLFPEQAVNWDYMIDKIKNAKRPIKVLNLFAYTGGATVACAYAGAEVVHVDAAKCMIMWAIEN
jgi:23S rRNA (cytosine1962-C5)-methyltransferase